MAKSPVSYSITPWLNVSDSLKALNFYKAALGAVEVYRLDFPGGVVARLSVHGAEFWLGDASPQHGNHSPETLGGSTVRMILTVPAPEVVFNQAVKAGAKVIFPVVEQHGWKLGRVTDPFGHIWEIGFPLT